MQRFWAASQTRPAPQKYGQGSGAQVPIVQRMPLGHSLVQALTQMPGFDPSLEQYEVLAPQLRPAHGLALQVPLTHRSPGVGQPFE